MNKAIKTSTEYRVNGVEDAYRTLVSTSEYDEKGNLVLEIQYFPSGEIYTEQAFNFDNNLLVKENSWNENGDCTTIDYDYNEQQILIGSRTTFSDGSQTVEQRTFTDNQEIIKQFDEGNQLVEKQVLTYNHQKQLVAEETFGHHQLISKDEYHYNSKGELEAVIRKNHEQETAYFETYQFKENEEIMIRKDESGEILYATKSIYEKEKLIESITEYHHWGDSNSICKYKYDEKDNLTKETHFDFDGHVTYDAIYTYNEYQDIVKMIIVRASGANRFEIGYLDEQIITEYELAYF